MTKIAKKFLTKILLQVRIQHEARYRVCIITLSQVLVILHYLLLTGHCQGKSQPSQLVKQMVTLHDITLPFITNNELIFLGKWHQLSSPLRQRDRAHWQIHDSMGVFVWHWHPFILIHVISSDTCAKSGFTDHYNGCFALSPCVISLAHQ